MYNQPTLFPLNWCHVSIIESNETFYTLSPTRRNSLVWDYYVPETYPQMYELVLLRGYAPRLNDYRSFILLLNYRRIEIGLDRRIYAFISTRTKWRVLRFTLYQDKLVLAVRVELTSRAIGISPK